MSLTTLQFVVQRRLRESMRALTYPRSGGLHAGRGRNDDYWNITKLTLFDLSVTESGSGLNFTNFRIDNGEWIEYDIPFTFSTLSEGLHTLYFFSSDKAGNNEKIKSIKFFIDNSPPTTFIDIGEPKYRANDLDHWNVTSETIFNLTVTDISSGIERTLYKIDDGLWHPFDIGFNLMVR